MVTNTLTVKRKKIKKIHKASVKDKQGFRKEQILKEDKTLHDIYILSFREPKHLKFVVDELFEDKPIAFHGWGVSGVGKRVDKDSTFHAFWDLKKGRPPGSKIPLLEPAEYAVHHIDWQSVHPNFRYLKDPKELRELWKSMLPFHLIFPYYAKGKTLTDAVVTPAFDLDVAPSTPVPTICLFWMEDPALNYLIQDLKKRNPRIQIGVSSLNDTKETPPFNTEELIAYLKDRKITNYNIVVQDHLLEPIDIASSHSQFIAPLKDSEPVWTIKRKGSLSASAFTKHTGFNVKESEDVRIAARRSSPEVDLDSKLYNAIKAIQCWHRE